MAPSGNPRSGPSSLRMLSGQSEGLLQISLSRTWRFCSMMRFTTCTPGITRVINVSKWPFCFVCSRRPRCRLHTHMNTVLSALSSPVAAAIRLTLSNPLAPRKCSVGPCSCGNQVGSANSLSRAFTRMCKFAMAVRSNTSNTRPFDESSSSVTERM